MEKKKISLKEIGLPKLIMLFVLGIFLILSSFPGLFTQKNKKETLPLNAGDEIIKQGNNLEKERDLYVEDLEDRYKQILKKVSHIGDVEVMITLKTSKEKITLKDGPYTQESSSEEDGEGGKRSSKGVAREDNTVLVTNEKGEIMPYIIQEIEPEIEGVLVIAQGGDNINVVQDIIEATEILFDIPIYKVKVMKMNDK